MTNSVIFQSIALHLGGLFFLIFVTFLYFRKGRVKNYSAGYYVYIMITTYLMNLTQIFAFISRHLFEVKGIASAELWSIIFGRGFILSSLLFGAGFECYFIAKMVNKNDNKKFNTILFCVTHAISLIFFILTFFYEVKFHTDSAKYVLNGPFSIWTYATFGLGVICMIFSMIKNRKNMVANDWLVLIYVFTSFILLTVVEKYTNYDISEVPYVLSLCITTIFFTLENTNYTKLQQLYKEEEENKLLSENISNRVNTKSQEMIDKLNSSYILIDLALNSDIRDDELNNVIDNLTQNNDDIIEILNRDGDN